MCKWWAASVGYRAVFFSFTLTTEAKMDAVASVNKEATGPHSTDPPFHPPPFFHLSWRTWQRCLFKFCHNHNHNSSKSKQEGKEEKGSCWLSTPWRPVPSQLEKEIITPPPFLPSLQMAVYAGENEK